MLCGVARGIGPGHLPGARVATTHALEINRPRNTVVECRLERGIMEDPAVTPSERLRDLEVLLLDVGHRGGGRKDPQ